MKKKKKAATQKSWIIAALERLQSEPELPFFIEFGGETLSRKTFFEHVNRLAGFMSANDLGHGTRVIFDIDTHVYWQTFAVWCACQMVDAVACIWPPDMRYRHIEAELNDAISINGFPAPVVVRSMARLNTWLKNDRDKEIEGRKFLYIASNSEDDAAIDSLNAQLPSPTITPFNRANGPTVSPALVDATVARLYTQGSHLDARPVEIPYVHLQEQAEDLKLHFNLDSSARIFIDLHTPHTVVLSLFAACAHTGAVFCCKSPEYDALDCLQHDVTHAFLLPTTLENIRKKALSPASAAGKKWRQFCLKAGHFNARHSSRPQWTRSLIDSICIHPLKNKVFCDLKAVISYGDHFNSKTAEFYTDLGITVYNAYTTCEFGFVHIHEFMGKGSYLKSVEVRIRNGILAVKSRRGTHFSNMDDLVFEDERCGICTHRNFSITLSSGTSVDVSPMREIIARHPVIDEIFIFGQDRPFLTALIYLDRDALNRWAQSQKLPPAPFSELAQTPSVYTFIRSIVDDCNLRRSTFENIQKIAVIPRTLAEDPRILTPTGLTRRTTVEHRYASLLDAFYSNNY